MESGLITGQQAGKTSNDVLKPIVKRAREEQRGREWLIMVSCLGVP